MEQYLDMAARTVAAGGVIAYPTEGVYGLGCDPINAQAVERLLAIKQRPLAKGLILLAADLEQLAPFIDVSESQYQTLANTWPAPVTYLVTPSPRVPGWVCGAHAKVAVRVPDHPLARRLLARMPVPLISTSANISGRPAPRNRFQVARQLGHELDFLVTGDCDRAAKPSTIIDLETGQILRP